MKGTRGKKGFEMSTRLLVFTLATFFLVPCFAHADEKYPSKPVRIVISTLAGTTPDIEARMAQPFLQKYLGVPIVIEDMPGTGGRLATEFVNKEKPDGYTLLNVGMPSCQTGEVLFKGRYKTLDLTHIYSLYGSYNSLVVKYDAPYKDMAEFIAKHKGKTLSCAIPGFGMTSHVNGVILTDHLGLTVRWVPYEGSTESLAALIGGHVDYAVGDVSGSLLSMVQSKAVRFLMVFSDTRDPQFPDVPTPKDLGIGITPIATMRAITGPPKMPPEVVKTLESAFAKVAQDQEFLAMASKSKLKVIPKNSAELLAVSKNTLDIIKGQEERLRSVVKPQK